jgi:ubiquinone/menaquinone biosynthesis C-methylase UbiE/uncharacterized protein YbaR (Trm112 family)
LRTELVACLRCAVCGEAGLKHHTFEQTEDTIIDGVLWCTNCDAWYPIEDRLLELLAGDLAYGEDRRMFWQRYADQLKALGLKPDQQPLQAASTEQQAVQQKHFDWYAHSEKQTYSEYEQMPFWVAADRLAFDPWRAEIKPGAWLLDVGCAQGRSTFKVMDLDLNIVGIDVSKHLVRQAIERYTQGDYPARASFIAADASRLPFVDRTFDYVLIYGVLHHLPAPDQTCQEVVRVLKDDGVYLGSENNRTIFRAMFDWLQKLLPIWHEEAGPEALISRTQLDAWFAGAPIQLETQTRVFLPPHALNLVSPQRAYQILRLTDSIGQSIGFLRGNGGLIVVKGSKHRAQSEPA